MGSNGPGGWAAGEGEEHGVGGAHHGVTGDGELELPEQVGPEALAAHGGTSRRRDGRAAAVALAARSGRRAGGDREPAQPLLRSTIHGARGGRAVGPTASTAAGGGGGHGERAGLGVCDSLVRRDLGTRNGSRFGPLPGELEQPNHWPK